MGLFDIFKRKFKTKDQPRLVKKPAQGRQPVVMAEKKPLEKRGERAEEKKPAVPKVSPKAIKAKKISGQAFRVLLKPLVTEKSAFLGSQNQYVFAVAPSANKIMVKKAIEDIYGVKPIQVNIVNVLGKNVRSSRTAGKTKDWKKAIVMLPAGEKIKVYEGV